VARTTQRRREAATPGRGRFARGSTHRTRAPGRFARGGGQVEPVRRFGRASARPSGGAPRRRRGQPDQGGAQKLMQIIQGVLPGGRGKSAAKSGKLSRDSMAAVADRLSSLGAKKPRSGGRARKPAIFGALGAGAAGAAAAVARRRHSRRSSQPVAESRNLPEAQATATAATAPAHPADASPPDTTDHGPDIPPDPDTPAAGDTR
jgi:hypothetical protein